MKSAIAKASLTVVGSGIKFISHLTTETQAYIKKSNKVLYLVNEPAMKEWIRENNPSSESLDELYTKYPLRKDCYRAITEYILETVRKGQHVCVVLYGHPAVFAQPALDAVRQAKKEGYDAKLLPAISAEDCLFSDLLIDPGSCGCQSFEATDFIIRRRKFDPNSHLILWQIDVIGVVDHGMQHDNTKGMNILLGLLKDCYKDEHEVIVYEAAQYPMFEPKINRLPLQKLATVELSPVSTLYIPPAGKSPYDKELMSQLGIDLPAAEE